MDWVSAFKVDQCPDRILWRWDPGGRFSVKSAYSALSEGGVRDVHANKLWRLRIPLKGKIFYWIVLKKRLLTADNLIKRGWTGDTTCVLCGSEEETMDHLFTNCVFAKFILVTVVEGVQVGDLGADVHSVWDRWVDRKGPHSKLKWITELAAYWWII